MVCTACAKQPLSRMTYRSDGHGCSCSLPSAAPCPGILRRTVCLRGPSEERKRLAQSSPNGSGPALDNKPGCTQAAISKIEAQPALAHDVWTPTPVLTSDYCLIEFTSAGRVQVGPLSVAAGGCQPAAVVDAANNLLFGERANPAIPLKHGEILAVGPQAGGRWA